VKIVRINFRVEWWKVRRSTAVCREVLGGIFVSKGHSVSSVTGPQGNTEYIHLLPNIAAPEKEIQMKQTLSHN